jgi:steroid delta-isomerase-like uncharacterized protein
MVSAARLPSWTRLCGRFRHMAETTAETPKKPAAKPRRSAKSKAVEKTAREFFAATGAHDVDAILDFWIDDGVEEIVPVGVFRGKEEIREFVTGFLSSSSDLEVTVDRVVADDSRAVVEWRFRGTFDGKFQGIEPTGKSIDLRGADILEIEDGKVTRLTAYYDSNMFARQVGLMPPQDSGAEKAMKGAFNAVTKVRKAIDERRA